jgi:UDP-N-acetylglucosamine 2-epimerase (non-hydrolysing)
VNVVGKIPKILTVCGTRPEAIKLAPVVLAALASDAVDHHLCVTGQHRQMLDQVLAVFGLTPDSDLNIMRPGQSLDDIASAALIGIGKVIDDWSPDWVIVQGDTSTAFAASLAAFHRKVKVAHVEAGLRTGNMLSPWPEEGNRRLIGQLAAIHFPPTRWAEANLLREGIPPTQIEMTGNTVIDALTWVKERVEADSEIANRFSFLNPDRRLILVTGHRRENFDGGLKRVCQALAALSKRDDIEILYPVHLNPNVQTIVASILGDSANVHLIEPQDYRPFVHLMQRAHIIVTDSGGIQEEAPGLGKPVLVTRDTTERPEAVEAGTARLIGTSSESLIAAVTELLDNPASYAAMAQAKNPFGDGKSAPRIIARLIKESQSA